MSNRNTLLAGAACLSILVVGSPVHADAPPILPIKVTHMSCAALLKEDALRNQDADKGIYRGHLDSGEPIIQYMQKDTSNDFGTPVNTLDYLLSECHRHEAETIDVAIEHLFADSRLGQLPGCLSVVLCFRKISGCGRHFKNGSAIKVPSRNHCRRP